jgi:SAM-dependent methyltransferase
MADCEATNPMARQPFYGERWAAAESGKPETDPLIAAKARQIRALLADVPDAKGVDAGCGAGALTLAYASEAAEVRAFDVAGEAVRAAAGKPGAEHVRFEAADLESTWPVPDAWADLVVSSDVVEHLFEFPSYFAEASRVLKPGARLYLTTPFHGRLKNVLLALFAFDRHFCAYGGGHIRFFTDAHLRRLAGWHNFEQVRITHLGRLWPLAKDSVLTARKAR